MRVDSHLHTWSVRDYDFFWIEPGSALDRDFTLNELQPQRDGIDAAILVQAAPSEAETKYLLRVAARSAGFVRKVVGWTDLAAPDGPERVAALAQQPLLAGLRPMMGFIADPAWILGPEVGRSLHAMALCGLRLDVPARVRHIPLLLELAARHPALGIVIDHAAKPRIAEGWCSTWADGMARIAQETGLLCKVSGFLDQAAPEVEGSALRPWIDHLLTHFGPRRLMWGSDWPVVTTAASYTQWLAVARQLLPGPSHDAVFGGTAADFYALSPQAIAPPPP